MHCDEVIMPLFPIRQVPPTLVDAVRALADANHDSPRGFAFVLPDGSERLNDRHYTISDKRGTRAEGNAG